MIILLSGITDFKTKFIINDKEGHYSVIMESIKETIMLTNIYANIEVFV